MAGSFKKHSPDERARLYNIYKHESWAGKSVAEIARELRVSKSTLLRWQRDEHAAKEFVTPPKSINEIMRGLCEAKSAALSFDILFDICSFNAWLRWPLALKYHYSAVASSTMQYLAIKLGVDSLADLPQDLKNGVVSFFSLAQFAELFCPQTDRQCDFTQIGLYRQDYTELQVAANIAKYILSSESPTVLGAYEALRAGVDGKYYNFSLSAFENFWRANLPSSPFLFIQDYHCELNWTPSPFEVDFVEYIDEIISRPETRRQYFANSRKAFHEMRSRIDPRSSAGVIESLVFPMIYPHR